MAETEKVARRLASQVDGRRHSRTTATVDQLLDRHFQMVTLERTRRETYVSSVKKHVRPLIGHLQVGALTADVVDSFFAELRRCREHCTGARSVDQRTPAEHECDDRCRPHTCRPLGASTIRQIHFILSGALKRAVRWRWIATNPSAQSEPPPAPRPDPRPPTAQEAAEILAAAWVDQDWGTLVWLAMVTGMRRGELCGLRWRDLDLEACVLALSRSIGQRNAEVWEKGTKTYLHRARRPGPHGREQAGAGDHTAHARLDGDADQAAALARTLDATVETLQRLDDARAEFLLHTAATGAAAEVSRAILAERHALDLDPEPFVPAQDWLDAARADRLTEDAHRTLSKDDLDDRSTGSEHSPVETPTVEPVDDQLADLAAGAHVETAVDDVRDQAADEPRPADEDVVRVPTPPETDDAVTRAERSLAEIRARTAEEDREAVYHQAHQLARWHVDDYPVEAAAASSGRDGDAADAADALDRDGWDSLDE